MNNSILLVEGIHSKAKEIFEKQGFTIHTLPSSAKEKELLSKKPAVLGIRSRTQLNASFFNNTKELWSVGAFCIGTNQIDLNTAGANGVAVFNSPYSNTRSVAELTIANIVNLSRKITYLNHLTHSGKWEKTSRSSYEVRGKSLGIIGYGHIGCQVSILAESLGMKVYYYDIQKKLSLGNAQAAPSLKEMLPLCDFITFHVPQTPQTKNMMTQKEFKLMKKGSYLINTSRGSTININDLMNALKEKHLYGAAIDVFPEEPAGSSELFFSALQKMENVILTPHIGGSTEEAQLGIAQDAAQRLLDYIIHGNSTSSVNFPQLTPPPLDEEKTLRIANIHANTPGVLSEINNIISKRNFNVQAQHLSTTSQIGYLVIDMEIENQKQNQDMIFEIQKLKTSIKTRRLPYLPCPKA